MKNYNYISPGVYINEFDETLTNTFRMDTDVLVPGYFSRGPIAVPVKLDDMSAYTIVFGTPETEAEKYAYYACKAVFDQGATVTALRMPYFNDTWTTNPKAEQSGVPFIASYKGLRINFKLAKDFKDNPTIGEVADVIAKNLAGSYESGITGENIVVPEITLDTTITNTDIAAVRKAKGTATQESDAIILNKFNDKLSANGKELLVSIIGAGNVMYTQGLFNINDTDPNGNKPETIEGLNFSIYDNVTVVDPGEDEDGTPKEKTELNIESANRLIIENTTEFKPSASQVYNLRRNWQYSGYFTDAGELAIAPETFATNLNSQFPTLSTYTVDGTQSSVSATAITLKQFVAACFDNKIFSIDNNRKIVATISSKDLTKSYIYAEVNGTSFSTADGENPVTFTILSPKYNWSGGFISDNFVGSDKSPSDLNNLFGTKGTTVEVSDNDYIESYITVIDNDKTYIKFTLKVAAPYVICNSQKMVYEQGEGEKMNLSDIVIESLYASIENDYDPDLSNTGSVIVNNYFNPNPKEEDDPGYNPDYEDIIGQLIIPADTFVKSQALAGRMKSGTQINYDEVDVTNNLLVIPGESIAEEGSKIYINENYDDFITVVVSQIVPSTSEVGKFNIVDLEVWNGSIDPMSMNAVSRQSDYIGDIINNGSDYIQYYSRSSLDKFSTTSKGYVKSKHVVTNINATPYRFSWIPKTIVDAEGAQDLAPRIMKPIITPVYNDEDDKVISQSYAERDNTVNWISDVLTRTLDTVKNKIVFTFRDCVDAGLSSIYNYFATPNAKNAMEYDPEEYTVSGDAAGDYAGWKLVAAALSQFCQFKHKLSMFHIDGPRNLVIDGTLSRAEDEYVPMLNASKQCMFNPKTLAVLKLGNTSYSQTNLEWWECYDVFSQRKIWLPSSIKTIGNLMYNDFNRHVWDAPAGQNYGVVGDAFRPAFNPEIEVTDKIYAQYLNYGNSWPNGVMTIEGQKTNYAENSAFNRINVRRLFLYLERWAQTVCQTFVYEPNNMYTWQRMKDALEPEFARIFNEGGLYDYRIVIDERNNPPEVIDNNELRVAIFLQPVKTAERILVSFISTRTGLDLDERIAQGIEY